MSASPDLQRYERQMRYAPLGEDGQRRLTDATALICGCGALGSVAANTLARAGIGRLRIVDRDFLEWNNLQRQVLYDEEDVRSGLPKAVAAAHKLQRINSQITVEPIVEDVNYQNIEALLRDVRVIVDGTDNFETRFLLNDASIRFQVPWIYGGCIGAEGQTMTIIPGQSPCLRCLMSDTPPPGTTPTCDTAGILAPIINVIASIQACEAMKILSGNLAEVSRTLNVFELWENRIRQIGLDSLRSAGGCATCRDHEFPWLAGERGGSSAVLCGRNAVQLTFPKRDAISLAALEAKLQGIAKVTRNPFLVRIEVDQYRLTVFPDGRAIIGGTEQVAEAKSVYAKYVGN